MRHLITVDIAGQAHHALKRDATLQAFMETDDFRCVAQREPRNEADENAIELYWRGFKVGYVPAVTAQILAPLMDAGVPLVFEFRPRRQRVAVSMRPFKAVVKKEKA